MQDLGLSDYTPRAEGRLKTLLWPTIHTEIDIDTVTRQGFWLCMAVAGFSVLAIFAQGWLVLPEAMFFFLAGVGVRNRSAAAAAGALLVYAFTTFLLVRRGLGGGVVARMLLTALLLANVRATWLAAKLRQGATEPPPVPLGESWSERFSDRMPVGVWPWGRWIYYLLAAWLLLGMMAILARLA